MLQHFVRTSDCKVRGLPASLLRRCCTTVVDLRCDVVNDEDEDSEESEPEELKALAFAIFELCRATK